MLSAGVRLYITFNLIKGDHFPSDSLIVLLQNYCKQLTFTILVYVMLIRSSINEFLIKLIF